jgi:Flp pilus assembly pilin Flp
MTGYKTKIMKLLPRKVRRFNKDEEGATAVEFALIAGPFFLLIFAIIETSLYFFAGQYLETAVDDTTRLFRTGQLNETTSNAQFRTALCNEVKFLFDCSNIRTDVQVAARFDDLGDPPEPDGSGNFPADGFDSPDADIIMQVTASYKWPVYTNFSAPLLHTPGGKYALMRVTAVTRTEPYK